FFFGAACGGVGGFFCVGFPAGCGFWGDVFGFVWVFWCWVGGFFVWGGLGGGVGVFFVLCMVCVVGGLWVGFFCGRWGFFLFFCIWIG
ncbi:hypothetical protein AAGG42_22490, partial [Stenotrophomonas maltophilia]|uniref:hypothetical protein n=1 Tax=Stenotrophomonas maltophilia TaxID=40324 RepID=UPI003145213C